MKENIAPTTMSIKIILSRYSTIDGKLAKQEQIEDLANEIKKTTSLTLKPTREGWNSLEELINVNRMEVS